MPRYTLGPDVDLDEDLIFDEDGTRITEERAAAIAAEAIAGANEGA